MEHRRPCLKLFYLRFPITDSAALAHLHVEFPLPETEVMIEDVAVTSFKICATVTLLWKNHFYTIKV